MVLDKCKFVLPLAPRHSWLSKYLGKTTIFPYNLNQAPLSSLSAASDSVKVTSWSQLTRNTNYNDLSLWQLSTDLSPCANNTTQKATKETSEQTSGSLTWSAAPEKQCSSVLSLNIWQVIIPLHMLHLQSRQYTKVQAIYESTGQPQVKLRDRDLLFLAVVLGNQCFFHLLLTNYKLPHGF